MFITKIDFNRLGNNIRIYFLYENFNDSLLEQHLTKEDIIESTEYVNSFALTLGVMPENIFLPTPYKVQKQALLFTYKLIAQRKAMYTNNKEVQKDAFAMKYEMYSKSLEDLEQSITADTYTEGKVVSKKKFPMTVKVYRG